MPVNARTNDFHATSLPPGYRWCSVSHDEILQLLLKERNLEHAKRIPIARSQSWVKMIASIIQLSASCITLYRTRGSQLDQYGYAAFGLTVFPYALMSVVNFVCLAIVGDYACVYTLRTGILCEAESRLESDKAESSSSDGGLAITIKPPTSTVDNTALSWSEKEDFPIAAQPPTSTVAISDGAALSSSEKEELPITAPTSGVAISDNATLSSPEGGDDHQETFELLDVELYDGVLKVTKNDVPREYKLVDRECEDEDVCTLEIDPTLSEQPMARSTKGRYGSHYNKLSDRRDAYWPMLTVCVAMFLGFVLPYLFIFALTKFRKQQSTVAQRAWHISWLVANQIIGGNLAAVSLRHPMTSLPVGSKTWHYIGFILVLVYFCGLYLAPSIGEFVTVGEMIHSFGTCSLFD